jgi:hypothetical protein
MTIAQGYHTHGLSVRHFEWLKVQDIKCGTEVILMSSPHTKFHPNPPMISKVAPTNLLLVIIDVEIVPDLRGTVLC